MYKKENIKIKIKTGLHARPASKFVQRASEFDSEIKIIFKNQTINAKSIMGVMSLGISKGDKITIKANGNNEKLAVEGLNEFLQEEITKE